LSTKSQDITLTQHKIELEERWQACGHKSGILWFTGLSGAGKTTLAFSLERRLHEKGYRVFVIDGDNVRHGLSADLGFSQADREENIRRVGEVAKLFATAGILVITALISPYRSDREKARAQTGGLFHEVFIDSPLATCMARDPKGLYAKAKAGLIAEFTGVSAPYEAPLAPELAVETSARTVEESLAELEDYVTRRFTLSC
jgi:adenylyl-sulfate kinase